MNLALKYILILSLFNNILAQDNCMNAKEKKLSECLGHGDEAYTCCIGLYQPDTTKVICHPVVKKDATSAGNGVIFQREGKTYIQKCTEIVTDKLKAALAKADTGVVKDPTSNFKSNCGASIPANIDDCKSASNSEYTCCFSKLTFQNNIYKACKKMPVSTLNSLSKEDKKKQDLENSKKGIIIDCISRNTIISYILVYLILSAIIF